VRAQLALAGRIVTVEAIGWQTAMAPQIVTQAADYVLALKENQPTRHAAAVAIVFREGCATGFAPGTHDHQRTVAKNHGRIEVREVWTVDDPALIAYLDPQPRWPRLRRVAMVVAERRRGEEIARETRYSLSSLPGNAALVGNAVRGHWGIENRGHWVLDIACREDDRRVRQGHADRNLAVLRRLAINLLCQEPTAKMGAKAKRRKAGWDQSYLLKILGTYMRLPCAGSVTTMPVFMHDFPPCRSLWGPPACRSDRGARGAGVAPLRRWLIRSLLVAEIHSCLTHDGSRLPKVSQQDDVERMVCAEFEERIQRDIAEATEEIEASYEVTSEAEIDDAM
jgi:predicted transposase YbfD/YdcC